MAIFGLCDTLWSRTHDPVQYITLFGKELGVKIYATCGLFERYKEDSAGREMIPEPVLESDPAAEAEGAAKLLKTLTRLLSDVEAEGRRIAERKQATGQKGPDKIFYPGRKVDPQPLRPFRFHANTDDRRASLQPSRASHGFHEPRRKDIGS